MAINQDMGDSKDVASSAPKSGGTPDFSNYGQPGLVTQKVDAAALVNSRISEAKSTTGT